MKRFAFGALALVFVVSGAGLALAQLDDIDDIHQYDPVTGDPTSPYEGTLVSVQGRIFVVNNTYNGGTHYIQDANGNGINFFLSSAPPLNYGDLVQVDGYVVNYNGELSITNDYGTYPDPIVTFLGAGDEPDPTVMTVDEVLNGYDGEDQWEGMSKFVEVSGVITEKNGDDDFSMRNEAATDTVFCYIDSTTQIGLGAMEVGEEYTILSPITIYGGNLQLKPRKQGDLIEGSGPVIDNIELDDWSPLSTDAVTVTAEITDDVAVTAATLYYRDDNGDSTGVFLTVPMASGVGDNWSATIPAPHNERQVDFYIEALDGDANVSANPGDAPAGWHEFAVGFTPIYDVQYRDPSSDLQGSDYFDRTVNLNGIVMVGTGDAGSNSKFIMQDDKGAFNGILVYEGSSIIYVLAGDEVEVGGYIDEYFGLTEMAPHTAAAVEVVSYDNDLFPPVAVSCGHLSDNTLEDLDDIYGEAYESVWVQTMTSTVTDTTGFDPYFTFLVSDAPGDTLTIDPIVDLINVYAPGDVVGAIGFMNLDYGEFELIPLADEYIGLVSTTPVEDELPQVLPAGGFSRIAPNPFNPKTEIAFVLTRDNLAQLNVYNIRGELVNTLASGRMQPGEHVVTWDGTDFAGERVSSGTYFARLRIGVEVMQVRKLMLVK